MSCSQSAKGGLGVAAATPFYITAVPGGLWEWG